jgi:hypothetical protein
LSQSFQKNILSRKNSYRAEEKLSRENPKFLSQFSTFSQKFPQVFSSGSHFHSITKAKIENIKKKI